METYKDIFREKDSQNWFKACLALKIVKGGLQDFLLENIHQLQQTILNSVLQTNTLPQGTVCNQCKTQNVLPCPTKDICTRGRNCKYHDCISNQPKVCPTGICQGVSDGIKASHRYNNPSWKNTDSQQWSNNNWTIGTCFLPPDGYTHVTSIDETDFNGVLSILMNCMNFQQKLSFDLTQTPNVLTDARVIGREVRHSPDLKVSDADLTSYFCTLTTLLGDPVCLKSDRRANEALSKLHQLAADKLVITGSDVKDIISDAKKDIENQKINAKSEISKEQESSLVMIEDAKSKAMSALDTHMKRLTENQTANYDVLKREFKEDILAYYHKEHDALSMFPLVPEADANINQLYVPPQVYQVEKGTTNRNIRNKPSNQNKGNPIVTYKEVLCSSDRQKTNIYVTGMAGMGKTSLCKRVTSAWWEANQQQVQVLYERLPKEINTENSTNYETRFSDMHTLNEFQFLFYIPLRDSHGGNDINDMIKEQIVGELSRSSKYDGKFLEHVLHTEKCLVLLDGLDEFSHGKCNRCRNANPHIPHRNTRDNCVILTTSRHWKMDDIRLKDSQIDQEFELAGFESSSSIDLIRKVTSCINLRNQTRLDPEEFITNIFNDYKDQFPDLVSIPIVLMQMLSLWCDGKALGKSKCQIYSNMVEMLLRKGNQRSSETMTRTKQSSNEQNTNKIPTCLENKLNIREQWPLIKALGQLAFHTLFPENNERSLLVFDNEEAGQYMSPEQLAASLEAGFLSRSKKQTFSEKQSIFSYLHKTYQEFFCAIHLVCEKSAVENICSRISCNLNSQRHKVLELDRNIHDLSMVYTFLGGMDLLPSRTLSEAILRAIGSVATHWHDMFGHWCFRLLFTSAQDLFQNAENEILANTTVCKESVDHCCNIACVNKYRTQNIMQHMYQRKEYLQLLYIEYDESMKDMCVEILHSVHHSIQCLLLYNLPSNILNDLPLSPNLNILQIGDDYSTYNVRDVDATSNMCDCFDLSPCTKLTRLILEFVSPHTIIVPVDKLKICCINTELSILQKTMAKFIGKFHHLSELVLNNIAISEPLVLSDCAQLSILELVNIVFIICEQTARKPQWLWRIIRPVTIKMPECLSLETCKLDKVPEQVATRVCQSLSNAIKLKKLSLNNITVTCNIDLVRCNNLSSVALVDVQAPQILLNGDNLTECTLKEISHTSPKCPVNINIQDCFSLETFELTNIPDQTATHVCESLSNANTLKTLSMTNITVTCNIDLLGCNTLSSLKLERVHAPRIYLNACNLNDCTLANVPQSVVTDTLNAIARDAENQIKFTVSLDDYSLVTKQLNKAFASMKRLNTLTLYNCVSDVVISDSVQKLTFCDRSYSNMSLPLIPDGVEELEFKDMDVKVRFPVIPHNVRQLKISGIVSPLLFTRSRTCISLPLISDSVRKLEFSTMDISGRFPVIPDSVRDITLIRVYMSSVTLRQLVTRISEMSSPVHCQIICGNVVFREEFNDIKNEIRSSKCFNVIEEGLASCFDFVSLK